MLAFSSGIARVSDGPSPYHPICMQVHASLWRLVPLSIVAEYLRGNGKTDDNECAKLFKDYQKCLHVGPCYSYPRGVLRGLGLACLLTICPIGDDI